MLEGLSKRILKPLRPVQGGELERMTVIRVLSLQEEEEDLESVPGGLQAEALVVETGVLSFRTGLLEKEGQWFGSNNEGHEEHLHHFQAQ